MANSEPPKLCNPKKHKRTASAPASGTPMKRSTSPGGTPLAIPCGVSFSRLFFFASLLVLANFQGHYIPLFWSATGTPAVVPSLLPSDALPGALRVGKRLAFRELLQGKLRSRKLNRDSGASLPDEPAASNADSDRGDADSVNSEEATAEQESRRGGRDSQPGSSSSALEQEGPDRATSSSQSKAGDSNFAQGASAGHVVVSSAPGGNPNSDRTRDPLDDGNDAAWSSEGDSMTPYVTFHRINMTGTPECSSVVPLGLQRNVNRSPITSLKALDESSRRALVFMARYGLGNSLRGFVSAYVYARVSGRTLVRFHGAEHTKVYDSLCMAFNCGFDSIHWDNQTSPMQLYKALDVLNPFPMYKASAGVRDSIKEDVPVMLSRSPSHFDGFWRNQPGILSCVYASFACSSTWCVHSRALHGLLRGPTPMLKTVVKQILRKHSPSRDPKGHGRDILAARDTDMEGRLKPMKGVATMFDVALHMRTRTAAIESKEGGEGELSRVGCPERPGEKPQHQFLKQCLWDCIDGLISHLDQNRVAIWASKKGAKRTPPRMSILLTTDNESLRPIFVKKLSQHGNVYYSSGNIVHLSKSAGSDVERLPTMAEFYLMARSHTIIEAGSYVSTFAYFAALYGNGTLASIGWLKQGGCTLKLSHQAEMPKTATQTM